MDPKSCEPVAADPARKAGLTDLVVYRVVAEAGVWRIDYQGVRCGRFATPDEALSTALKLARECAALGRPALVRHDAEGASGGAFQEWLQARPPVAGIADGAAGWAAPWLVLSCADG